jgi:hypothetical protein
MKTQIFQVFIVAGALWLASEGTTSALEFIAVQTTQIDGQTRQASIYYRDEMWRVEHNDMGPVNVTIVRKDKGLVWLLLSRTNQFKTVPFNNKAHAPQVTERLEGEVSREAIGREILHGHPTTVYRITVKTVEGGTAVYYQWLATDIRFPLRLARKDSDWLTEFTNVRLTHLSNSLFRLPRNYQPVGEKVPVVSLRPNDLIK